MSYGKTEVELALRSIGDGTASFDVRADLEHHLLGILRDEGTAGVARLLDSLAGYTHSWSGDEVQGHSDVRGFGKQLTVTTFCNDDLATVNVVVNGLEEAADADPRHRAFYDIWEALLGLSDADVEKLDPTRRAVYMVALFEAEVMNGGLGQYLANTGGAYVDVTRELLHRIGARGTAGILDAALQLSAGYESYDAAWEVESEAFAKLDRELLESAEDLAGLAADFLQLGAG